MKKLSIIILFLFFGFIKVQANCLTQIVPIPIVDSITVDIAGNVTICWQSVVDPDIAFYAIFMVNPLTGANDSIDSVGVLVNCYTIPAGSNDSDIDTVEYGVVAVDNCGNPSLPGGNYTNTIFLENTPDPCNSSILLTWNPYDDFTSGQNVLYNIYVSTSGSGGPYSIDGTSTTTSYTYNGIIQGVTYDFYVMAIENSGAGPFTSSSNDININTIAFFKDPLFNYLYTATVVDSQQINLQFFVDTAADVSSYTIRKSVSSSGPFAVVGSVSAYYGMNPLVQFSDYDNVNANNTFYFYKVETINSCGNVKFISNIGRTIWLDVTSEPINATNTLTITQYDGWLGNVNKYDIYRSVGGIWGGSPVATLSSFNDTISYIDNIYSVLDGNGEFCYKVIATEGVSVHVDGSPPATSLSNEACALHEPIIYIPNAFAPFGSYNTEFKPILTYSAPSSYLFQIYNKWGQKIFETKNVMEAWNGRMNNSGKMCQVDSYVYLIMFESTRGEEFSRRGVVTLVN